MNTTKSISGFLDIDSEKYLFKEKNEPMPDCLVNAKPGDKFTIQLVATINSTEVNTNTGMVDRVQFYFDGLKSITRDV